MRAEEREAVVTTIVGGRPPGSGKEVGNIPRGIEVLIKKAAVDADFRALLVARRASAAAAIKLELSPAEAAMLAAIPREQLENIIDHTEVPLGSRRAFLGTAAVAMIAALGLELKSCHDTQLKDMAQQTVQNPVPGSTSEPKQVRVYHRVYSLGHNSDRPVYMSDDGKMYVPGVDPVPPDLQE